MTVIGEPLEFECYQERDEDGNLQTYTSEGRWFDDGMGYYDVESRDPCPYCGVHHWETVQP